MTHTLSLSAQSRMPADEFAALWADQALARAAMGLWGALNLMSRGGAVGPVELDLSRSDRPRLLIGGPEGTPGEATVALSRQGTPGPTGPGRVVARLGTDDAGAPWAEEVRALLRSGHSHI